MPGPLTGTGGYVRHRDRMVAQSVYEDLKNTLIACRWMAGTTTREVVDPADRTWKVVTTAPNQVLPLVGKRDDSSTAEVVLIDYFPEYGGDDDETGASRKTLPNTLAVDQGVLGDASLIELGSNLMEQPYTFTMAFYAASDGVALAVLNDLRDRYAGRLVYDDNVDLYNFNAPGYTDATAPVVRMEVDSFTYELDATDKATPANAKLYFASLQLLDIVDSAQP